MPRLKRSTCTCRLNGLFWPAHAPARFIRLSCFLLLLMLQWFYPTVARSQETEPIRVTATNVKNEFPVCLTFTIQAEADQPLTEILFFYRMRGDTITYSQQVEFETGEQITATYTLDTAFAFPSTPFVYYWELTDQEGHQVSTAQEMFFYDDVTHEWQEIVGEDLIVRWYEGDDELGRYVYDRASQALVKMQNESGQKLPEPVILLLYANQEDFMAWQEYGDEWAGGLAFSSMGITAQIIPPQFNPEWVEDVIPHEIAHLFFYQVVHGPWASWPHWLDEGLAQYYEGQSPDDPLARAAEAARWGYLIPLADLVHGFGDDPSRVILAYDESLSVVVYIMETWGDEGLEGLIEAFHQGELQEVAVEQVLGVGWEEFEAGWITWMGVPTTPAPTPTATETFVFPPGPESWPTRTPTAMPSPTATHTPVATATPSPTATYTPLATATGTPPAAPTVVPAIQEPSSATSPACSLCGARPLGWVLAPMLLLFWRRRAH